ncbi:TRAP transporter, DctQ-like membrane protein [Candidatus Vecturithrix granuli]|uniref:TRAP transporter, DctQ-like membrane protein n=1 Tax=Vecturithrix granuli TaxID=1499967 RepID=A0A081C7B5_VECG1|nr:TRAP transporter, DctQ-like membrane protein [Candidatus Vecturithrix granuli]
MQKLLNVLGKIEEIFVTSALAFMGMVLALQILMRYIFNHPLVWSEELARYTFVWVTFVGASYGVHHNAHIRMEAIHKKFPPTLQKIVTISTNLLAILIFSYLIPAGIVFTVEQHDIASSAMEIPMSLVFAAVPVGCFVVAFRLLIQTIQIIKTGGGQQI